MFPSANDAEARALAGLVPTVGKAIAALPEPEFRERMKTLAAAQTKEDFEACIEEMAESVGERGERILRAGATGPLWKDVRAKLIRDAEASRHERMSPSS
ncbi:MAG: hypothetical protein ACYDDF_00760 [Thermoplasmatota archaeon]